MNVTYQYELNSYLRESKSRIIDRLVDESGIWITLDETIIYPGGGGQLPDRGFINDLPILDVKKENDVFWYQLTESPPDEVLVRLDWPSRYLNMQQHTGQHILSAVFYQLYNLNTLSVHLGHEETLIELDVAEITREDFLRAEEEANRIIRDHLPVNILFCSYDEMDKYPIRRDVKVESDPIRIIKIGEYDYTGCGGTHVQSTSEVGLIKIIKTEKIRGNTRLITLIGEPAYKYFDSLNKTILTLTKDLSCSTDDLSQRYENLIEENKKSNRRIKTITSRWLKEYVFRLEPENSIGYFVISDIDNSELFQLSHEWLSLFQLPCFMIAGNANPKYFLLRVPTGSKPGADEFVKDNSRELDLQGGGNSELVRGIITRENLSVDYENLVKQKLQIYSR